MGIRRYSEYDPFAWVYNEHWADISLQWYPLVEKLVLETIPGEGKILDLCCGTGNFARLLTEKGYRITGIDGSEKMLAFARENTPEAEFILGDARSFSMQPEFNAVISLFDSLNHIMTLNEMLMVFKNVFNSLLPGGIFFFDLNMEAAFADIWANLDRCIVKDDYVCVTRSSYDSSLKTGSFDATVFKFIEDWQRTDITLLQKCYSEAEVRSALEAAGFVEIRTYAYDEQLDLAKLTREAERAFFSCRKPTEGQ